MIYNVINIEIIDVSLYIIDEITDMCINMSQYTLYVLFIYYIMLFICYKCYISAL